MLPALKRGVKVQEACLPIAPRPPAWDNLLKKKPGSTRGRCSRALVGRRRRRRSTSGTSRPLRGRQGTHTQGGQRPQCCNGRPPTGSANPVGCQSQHCELIRVAGSFALFDTFAHWPRSKPSRMCCSLPNCGTSVSNGIHFLLNRRASAKTKKD